jgi:group I intron endonuclease
MKDTITNNYIYKVTNSIDGKIYIGATTTSVENRKSDQIKKSNKENKTKFYEAIATYGADSFEWCQIDTAVNKDELAAKEKEYILEYNSLNEGLNSDSGGGIQKTVYQYDFITGKLVDKYSNLTDASAVIGLNKKDLSSVCLSVNKVSKGFYWSYEFKEHYKPNKDKRKKCVQQYSLDGKLIDEFTSVAEASKKTNCNKTSITKVCRRERNLCGGFYWGYI